MKTSFRILLASFMLVCLNTSYGQDDKKPPKEKNEPAVKLPGEKEFEMKQYFFVMLSAGEKFIQDSAAIAKIHEGHMANMRRLAEMGKLIVAGPFGDAGNWRGFFIFDCKTKDEAEELVKTDPAIISGRMKYEIHPWWTAKNCVFK